MFSKCLGTVATSKVGDVDYHRHASLLSGAASIESVMYNPTVNQFERLLELGEGGKPAKLKFSISKVDMTQVVDNMEEVPLITEGETNSVFFFLLFSIRCQHQYLVPEPRCGSERKNQRVF